MRTGNAVIAALTAVGLLALAPSAFADGAGGNGRNQPIIGNVTGNGIDDRTTLGHDATSCTATVERGLGHGRFAAPVVHHYTVAGLTSTAQCPDLGATLARRASPTDDLAVTWFSTPLGVRTPLIVLRHFRVLSASPAGGQFPSVVGSQDFDGDHRGDIWESTDEDADFTTYLRSGSGFVPGPVAFFNDSPEPSLAFGPLDSSRGTDIAASYLSLRRDQAGLPGSAGSGALVVFGRTGAKVLLESDPTGHTRYAVAILDADHDGHDDVRVSDDTGSAPRIYLGDGRGHFARGT